MKKHMVVNNQLININKKWSDLKLKQKEYISNLIRETYLTFMKEYNKKPNKDEKIELLEIIYTKIKSRGIWIPFGEVEVQFNKKSNNYLKLA